VHNLPAKQLPTLNSGHVRFAEYAVTNNQKINGLLAGQTLVRLTLEGERIVREERLFNGVLGRIRDVRQGPDGLLYLLTDAQDGQLIRLEPAD
jgi:glucose/arabinose dehydrogenase